MTVIKLAKGGHTESAPVRVPNYALAALGAVILIFVALGTFIAVKTPAYESGDEPGHVQNIETLVSGHWYGMSSTCRISTRSLFTGLSACSGDEAQQAPLYYLLLAGWQRVAGVSAHIVDPGPIDYESSGEGVFTHHGSIRFLLWLRLPNVLLGALTILISYFAARLITSDPWTPVVAASFVAFLPRFVFLSSFITNDNLVALLGAVLVYLSLRYVLSPSPWRMAAVGATFGLLLSTKLSILPVGLVLIALPLLTVRRERRAQMFGAGVGAALVTSGWYLIQNTVRYGDPLAARATTKYLTVIGGLGIAPGHPYVFNDPLGLVFVQVPDRFLHSFWYQSGWGQFNWPWLVGLAVTAAFVCALAGLIGQHIRADVLIALAVVTGAALLSVWAGAFQTGTYETRYAFVGLAALAVLAALGLQPWKLPVRFLLPSAGLVGIVVAIQENVLAVHWN